MITSRLTGLHAAMPRLLAAASAAFVRAETIPASSMRRLDGALVSLRTMRRVISSMRLHIKDRDSAHRPWQVRRFAGDDSVCKIVRKLEGYSRHFKCDIEKSARG